MNEDAGIQQRIVATLAAAAVSAMCVLGTVGPVQANNASAPVQSTSVVTTAIGIA